MECEVVHAIVGRVRLRVADPAVFNGLGPAFSAKLRGRPNVRSVQLNALTRSVVLTYDPDAATVDDLLAEVRTLSVEALEAAETPVHTEVDGGSTVTLALSSAAVALGMVTESILVGGLVFGAAVPIFTRALAAVREKRKLNVDVLDAAATAVLAGQGRTQTAAVMVWLVSLGDFIRDLTVQQSHRAIEDLFDGRQSTAWVVRDGQKVQVAVEQICAGNEVVVYPGNMIPVDGVVLRGKALVDQKMLTGESMPVEKRAGAEVYAATAVTDGKLYLRAAKVGRETLAAKIVEFVRDAPTRQTRIQNYAEEFADWVVPWSFLAAGGAFLLTGSLNAAAALLIIDYGTGIRVAAPTTVLASTTRAARRGILIKGGRHLERLAEVDTIVFDKTGTLTQGTPEILHVEVCDPQMRPDEVLALAAAAEQRLTHPVASAVVRAAEARGLRLPERDSSHYSVGLGVEASIGGTVVHVGSDRFMTLRGVETAPARARVARPYDAGASLLFVARDGVLVGVLVYADPLRPDAPAVLQALRERGIERLVMVTGDHPAVASHVAGQLGITSYVAEAFPEQKLAMVRALQADGHVVAVVGDGINDSPALVQADVGISVHGGADVAREAAHVALLEGSLWKLVEAIDVARESMRLIRQDWDLIFYPNSAAIVLSVLQVIGPVGATLISNGSAIVATLNSLRPLLHQNSSPSGPGTVAARMRPVDGARPIDPVLHHRPRRLGPSPAPEASC